MELDFDKYRPLDRSPTTVLPSPQHFPKVFNKNINGKAIYGDDITSLNEDFVEINFSRASYKNIRSQNVGQKGDLVLKRGSVYQTSQEVSLLQKIDTSFERKKIEFSQETPSPFSFEIIDSLCSSDEDSSITQLTSNFKSHIELSSNWDAMIASKSVPAPINESNSPKEKDMAVNFQKSSSSKYGSRAISPKSRFTPVRKMFDPFVKSKSHNCPLSNHVHAEILPRCSPAHLHGLLESGNKHGVPFLEFSVKSLEDVYVAKKCKLGNDSTFVCTFHSLHHSRKSNSSGWGFRVGDGELCMVGQMHASCNLRKESKGVGELIDSMVMEFVLYSCSSPNAIKAVSDEILSWGNCEMKEKISAKTKGKGKHSHAHFDSSSSSQPHAEAELHPDMEIAAITLHIPYGKRESRDEEMDETAPNLLDLYNRLGKANEDTFCKMHVVIPSGNHSLPTTTESRGPSSLLDRWRLGGGCECGVWDMACQLSVFSDPNVKIDVGHPLMEDRNLAELFAQGKKDNIPAFTMRKIEEGKYAVDFHAQLSSLQAFSICVAILHAAETSTGGMERSEQMLQNDALKVFAEDETEIMIESSAEEEKIKVDKIQEVLPSFVLNPPFSPIARV